MSATLLDGKALAAQFREELALKVRRGLLPVRPGLAVLLVGEDPASAVYVRNKIAACEAVGIHSICVRLPSHASQAEVLQQVGRFNADPSVHGVLVQLPLPPGIDASRVLGAVAPEKDVDGFGICSQGALMAGLPGLRPCTPAGVMALLSHAGVALRGAQAVVVGRSNIVGKPMALMLLLADATVTVCHSATPDLASSTRRADVLVVAAGRPRLITADMVKPGAAVIDVGIHREVGGARDGQLCGDVDFDSVRQVAGHITPVPGGVGPMTIAMLLSNTIEASRQAQRGEGPPAQAESC
jgi:methylenetetrahydrofolate dehydrogenase (NADP+) / methenyltetrahydrofolate cyclohydrolase